MSTNGVMTAERVRRMAAWRTDDVAAWERARYGVSR